MSTRKPRARPPLLTGPNAKRAEAPPRVGSMEAAREFLSGNVDMKRAWGGADDDRLTADHWGSMTSESINLDLVNDLSTLRRRARYERQHSGILEGMAGSWARDVVGAAGPILQVLCDDKEYAERA